MYNYFISYAYKKMFGRWGFGSCYVELYFPLNEETFDNYSHQLADLEKVKGLVILNYKEIPKGEVK